MTKTANYQPRDGSVPARLIAHLKDKGGSITSMEIAAMVQIDRKNVDNNLKVAVSHGLLLRDGHTYSLPMGEASQAAAGLADAWGGAARPAFPVAPPRAGDPPPKAPRKMRALKQVSADFHKERNRAAPSTGTALAAVPQPAGAARTTSVAHVEPIDLQPASLRQVGGTHYKAMAVQPWDVVDGWPLELRIGYYRGNALKYLMRMGSKDHELQEVEKCRHYVDKLIEVLRERDGRVAA
jgi:hypothetical protein